MKLFAFAASHRAGSLNRHLLGLAAKLATESGATVDVMEYVTFDAPPYDDALHKLSGLPEGARRFAEAIAACDGILLASPEYNWSFPGSLKNLIDWASCVSPKPFGGKVALLLSATPSMRGGAAGLIQLRVPLEALGVVTYPQLFALGQAPALLDETGLKDAAAAALLKETIAGFLEMTRRLKG